MEIHSDIQKHQSQPNSPLFFISVLDQFGDDGQPILEVAMDQATPTNTSQNGSNGLWSPPGV